MPNIKIVTSEWVQKSLQNNSRLDEEGYHPRLLIPDNSEEKSAVRTPATSETSASPEEPSVPTGIKLMKKNQIPSQESEVEEQPPPAVAPSTPSTKEVQEENPGGSVLTQIQNLNINDNAGKLLIFSKLEKISIFHLQSN